MADDDVSVKFGAQIEGLLAGVNDAKDAISGITEPIDGILESFQGLGEAAVAGFAVDRLYDFQKELAELGEQIERTSKMTGLSTDEVQEFGFAVKETGGDSDTAAQALLRFEANLAKAQAGTGPAAAAYEQMGISLKNADGTYKNIAQILPEVADKFAQTADGATKVEYATAIGSRGFAQLIPLLDQGSEGLQKLNDILASTNSKLSPEQVDALAASKRASIEADAAWKGFYQTIGSTGFFDKVNQDMKELAEAGTEVAKAIKQADKAFEDFISDSADRVPTATEEFIAAANQFKAKMAGGAQTYGPPAPAGKPALAPLPEGGAGADDGDKTQDQIDRNNYQTSLELGKLKLQNKKDVDQALVESGQISAAQQIADLQQMAAQEYAIELQAVDQLSGTYETDSAEYAVLQNKKVLLAQQYTNEVAKLNEQLAAAQKKQYEQELQPWKQLLGDMGGAYDTWVNGIISGTQTFKQATGRALDDLLVKAGEVFSKMTAEYLVFEATSGKGILGFGSTNPFAALGGAGAAAGGAGGAAATQALTTAITGNTASTLTNTGGILQEVESGLQWIAQTLGLTTTTVAQTTAATAAATASTASATATTGLIPTITANIAALTANTSALFTSHLLPSYDVGSWSIPSNQVAMVHAGEMIIPAGPAGAIRSGSASLGGAGGGAAGGVVSMNISLSAIDTQSGMQFLNQNAVNLGNIIAKQIRNGHGGLVSAVKS